MTGYFTTFLELELAAAEHLFRHEIAKARGAAAAQGTLRSGAQWIILEQILCRNLASFGERVAAKLTAFHPEHTPINKSDFSEAKNRIHRFRQRCEAIHTEFSSMESSACPKSRKPFEGGELDRAESILLNTIDGQRAVFDSKKSFWKWAWGDLRKRTWSGALILIGTVIGGLLGPFFKDLF
ncbi:hypothetical protein [Hyphomonas sp.]|uniref:hypothetical protein n=1 Tax=Hyphomonas sp. TaxID=87 RepID=UPI0025C6B9A7|nr:hypothetical protein [Hyphomonas sp.]